MSLPITPEIIALAKKHGACEEGLLWARRKPRTLAEMPTKYGLFGSECGGSLAPPVVKLARLELRETERCGVVLE